MTKIVWCPAVTVADAADMAITALAARIVRST